MLNPSTIYLGDNGRAFCGNCAGYTARMTGRDLSGQAVEPVTPEDAQSCESLYGFRLACETCGREASTLHTVTK